MRSEAAQNYLQKFSDLAKLRVLFPRRKFKDKLLAYILKLYAPFDKIK